MEFIQILIIGLIQGITEFLPISSSAHLILLPRIAGWADQGLVHDVAAHIGSLIAVIIYFRTDLRTMLTSWVRSFSSPATMESRLVWNLIVATVPIVILGALFHDLVGTYLRDPLIIAAATVVFGLLLWFADVQGKRLRPESGLDWRDACYIGVAQCLAMIPGTSRSGITITAGLLLGLEREAAARFSFLLSIPTIGLVGIYECYKLLSTGNGGSWWSFLLIIIVSGISAGLTIHYFLKFLEQTGMLPYVIYRLLLGAGLLILFY